MRQARFHRPAGWAFFGLPSQRQRRGKENNQLYRPRRMRGIPIREASPVTGSGGRRLECLHSSEPAPGDLWFFPSLERTRKGGFRRSGGGFLCPRRQRNQNAVFPGPFGKAVSSGGQNLSGPYIFFRATGPWRSGDLDFPLPPGPPDRFHAVGAGNKRRAHDMRPYKGNGCWRRVG